MNGTINWDEVELSDIPDEIKDEIIVEADAEKVMFIRLNIYADDFIDADPKAIHDSVYLPKCKVNPDEGMVWFQGVSEDSAKKWLYYIGAENEAKVCWMDGENLLYGEIHEGRLDMFEKDIDEEDME